MNTETNNPQTDLTQITSLLDQQKMKQQAASSTTGSTADDDQSFITQPSRLPRTPIPGSPSESSGGGSATAQVVDFTSSEIARLHAHHELSLFAKVLGLRVGYQKFSSHVHSLFNPEGNMDVVSLENGFFLLRFSNLSDYNKALQGVPWTINYHYITLHRWVPNFKPSETIITKVKVWIRLPELPVEYYDSEALLRISEAIGPLVKVDPVTVMMLKCKFARLSVELDLQNPLPEQVMLPNGVWQPVQYEGLQTILCYGCRRVGHFLENCPDRTSVPTPQSTSPPPGQQNTPQVLPFSHNIFNLPLLQSPPGGLQFGEFKHDPGCATGAGSSVWGSRFQVLANELNDSGLSPDEESEISPSIQKDNILESPRHQTGSAPNNLASASSSQAQKAKGALRVDTGTIYQQPRVYNEYFSSPLQPATVPHQVASSPRPPTVSSPGLELYYQAVLRGVEKREVNSEPVEIQERSTEGCAKVIEIDRTIFNLEISVQISPLPTGNGNLHQITVNPTTIDHTEYATPSSPKNKILSWNCRGASDPTKIQALKNLCKDHDPSIILLLETRAKGIVADQVIGDLGFSRSRCIDPVGYTGGVWLLWRSERINLDVLSADHHHISAAVDNRARIEDLESSWIVFGVDSD